MTTASHTPPNVSESLHGFRLSPQQRHLWTLQQQHAVFACQMVMRWTGNLEQQRLRQAMQQMVDRFDILRTRFPRQPGTKLPLQVIDEKCTPNCDFLDWRNLTTEGQRVRLQASLPSEQQQLIQAGQSYRLQCAQLSETESWLVMTLSPLCGDRHSLHLLLREIVSAYRKEEPTVVDAEGPVQYLQVSEWQNELLEDEDDDYWVSHSAPKSPLRLPLEQPSNDSFTPTVLSQRLPTVTKDRLLKLAQENEFTVADVLQACWQILIWKLTGAQAGAIHLLANGRDDENLEDVIGPLAKWLPLDYELQPTYQFTEVVDRVRSLSITARDYQDSFGYVFDNTESSEPNLTQLYNDAIGFEWCENFEWCESINGIQSDSVTLTVEQQQVFNQRFKLALTCVLSNRGLTVELQYDRQRLQTSDIQRIHHQFLVLVDSTLARPEQPIEHLSVLDGGDRIQLLQTFNETTQPFASINGIHTLFEEQVAQHPDNIAVTSGGQQLTYTQLNQKANQLARHLQQIGVGPDSIVGIYLLRSTSLVVALLAILKAGGAYLPLNPALSAEAVARRLADANATALVSQTRLMPDAPELVPSVVYPDENDVETIASYSTDNPPCLSQPNNLAYIIYTSGSTGAPKGVAIEHRQILNYLQAISTRLELPTSAHFALVSTIAADLGNTVLYPALTSGGCLHVIPEHQAADATALSAYFQQHPIDCLKIVPSHLAALLLSRPPEAILPKHQLIVGGEALSQDLLEQLQSESCNILNHYGPTETTVGVLTYPTDSSNRRDTVPLGHPLANCQVYILDRQLQPVPIGVSGDIYIGGAQVARGYLNRPSLTAERFLPNPFSSEPGARLYMSGDRGRFLADGTVEFIGRSDRQVKLRGYRIELGEIEAVLGQHPAIQQAAVTVWTKSPTDRRLAAYVVAAKGQPPSISNLRDYVRQTLPAFMRPSSFTLLKTMPLTANGKVDWRALPDPDLSRPELEATYAPPRTEAERHIADIWQTVLGIETVGINDNFFDLGGHSLSVIAMHAQLRDRFHQDIPITDLFQYTTISTLAAHLTQSNGQPTAAERSQDRAAARLASRQRRPTRTRS